MRSVVYEVIAHIEGRALVDTYLEWLGSGHVQGVLDGGARTAMVTVYERDGGRFSVESRYVFPSQASFDAYEAGPAEVLRAESRRTFADQQGIRFERAIGRLAFRLP